MTIPGSFNLPEGHFAIRDPHDPRLVSYWRYRATRRRVQPVFGPWPAKARTGPRLLAADVPAALKGDARRDWIRKWFADNAAPYRAAVIAALEADPHAAAMRFAELTSRCCVCGRNLTEPLSKSCGIGPECRSGLGAAVLAQFYVPAVARAHAERLSAPDGAT